MLHYLCASDDATREVFGSSSRADNTKRSRDSAGRKLNLGEDNLRMIQFLKLPDSSLERIAMLDDMAKKVNETISKSIALLVLHLTFVSIVMLITCYARLTYLMRIGVALPRLVVLSVLTLLTTVPLLAHELAQSYAMYKLGLFSAWASDPGNVIDMSCVLWVPVTLAVGFIDNTEDHVFEIVTSVGGLLLMFKLLHFLRFMNKSMAAFVSALAKIMSDIVPPCIALAIVLFGFGFAMFNLVSTDTLLLHDDDPDNVRAVPSDFVRAPQGISLSPALR